jgi:glycosyltransferase involved in cell wall biosynthesis
VTPAHPRLSIVIPTYERCALLQQAVDSALAQDAGDYEVVIVDDASGDDTRDYLCSLSDSRVRVFRNDVRKGMVGNWNLAVDRARGEFTYVLQDDDMIDSSLVATVCQQIAEHPSVGLVIFATVLIDAADLESKLFWAPEKQELIEPPDGLLRFARDWRISSSQVVFSRQLYAKHGGFDDELPIMSDAEAILRWLTHAIAILIPVPLARRRVWPGSVTSATIRTREMTETMAGLVERVTAEARTSGLDAGQMAELAESLRQTFLEPYRRVGYRTS